MQKMFNSNLLNKTALSFLLILFTGSINTIHCSTIKPAHDYCSMSNFETCLAMIEEVSRNEQFAFATTMEQLNETCSLLKKGVECLNFQFERCTSKNRFQAFEKIVTGTKKVIERLCSPGPVQDDYLKFSVCYRKVIFKYVKREQECNYWLKLLQNIQSQPANPNKSKEEQNKELSTFCCAYNKSLECQLELIRLHCDREALDFFYIHSNSMSQQLVQEHCAVFNEDNQKFCRYPVHQQTTSTKNQNGPNKKLKFFEFNNSSQQNSFNFNYFILFFNLIITILNISMLSKLFVT